MEEHLAGEGVVPRVQGRKLADQPEDVSVAGEPAEQGLAGGHGVLGDGPLPGRHIPTVEQNQRSPGGLAEAAAPSSAGQGGKRSAGDARAHARRLRSLPVDQVLGDFLFSLLNAGKVKLGRQDARLLIDVTAVAHGHASPHLPGEFTRQIGQVLRQLRLDRVNAEGHASQQSQPEQNDLDRAPGPPPTGTAQ